MVKIFYADVSGISDDAGMYSLSDYRMKKLSRLQPAQKRRLCIGAELLLARAIGTVFPEVGLPLKITAGKWGKPALDGGWPHFNLSHSGTFAVCAVSDAPVGIDIQLCGAYRPELVRRFFTEEESAAIEDAADKVLCFTRTWAVKESYIKMIGTGMNTPLGSFTVQEPGGLPHIKEDPGCRVFCADLDGYVLALSSYADDTEIELTRTVL